MSKSAKQKSQFGTEWHQAALSTDALHSLIMAMPIPIFITQQKDAHILLVNAAAQELCSSPGKAIAGETTLSLGFWASPLVRAQVIQRLNREGSVTEHPTSIRDGLGQLHTGKTNFYPLLLDGTPCMLACFQEDTQAINSEDQVLEKEARMRCQLQTEKMEAIGHLSSALAHDFNNILAAIMLRLELLSIEAEPSETICHAIHELNAEAKRAANITRQLLLFSRRESITRQLLDLNELLESCAETLSRLVCPGVILDMQPAAEALWVEADASHMEQVLFQLVANARDAMGNSGTITLRLGQVPITAANPSLAPGTPPGPHACIMVADQGCGMDENTRRHIFEPFFTTKPAGKGSGMGLATVYGIIHQHHGWIEVESQVNRGSVFTLYIPLHTKNQSAAKRNIEDSPKGIILIVEDDPSIRRLSSLLLQQKGFKVLEASNGNEGFSLWKRHHTRIRLLLIDLVLPDGLIGLDLLAEAKLSHPQMPAILMSGFDTQAEQQLELPECCGFLHKPFDSQSLLRAVQKALKSVQP